MAGIQMPDEQRLPPGPGRELVSALHELYESAGKPAVRSISAWIREDKDQDLPGTLSHEGVSSVLSGSAVPRWVNLESLVRVLIKKRRVGEPDVEATVREIHGLWRMLPGNPPAGSSASPPSRAAIGGIFATDIAATAGIGHPFTPGQRGAEAGRPLPAAGNARADTRIGTTGIGQTTQTVGPSARKGHAEAVRLLGEACRAADSSFVRRDSDPDSKRRVIARVVQVLAAIDAENAVRLLAEPTITEEFRAIALVHVVRVLAASDPDEAERIALSISDESACADALAYAAETLAMTEPDRAERLARSITSEGRRTYAIGKVAAVLAARDPDGAERLAKSIAKDPWRKGPIMEIARALADADPERAERLALSIPANHRDASWHQAIPDIAGAVVATDPVRALRLAQYIIDSRGKKRLELILRATALLADADPEQTVRLIAEVVIDEFDKATAVADAVKGLAVTDPDHATRLIAQSISNQALKAQAIARLAETVAAIDPRPAARLAQSIGDEQWKSPTCAKVAKALAATHLDQAERLAQSIADPLWRATALADIAESCTEAASGHTGSTSETGQTDSRRNGATAEILNASQ